MNRNWPVINWRQNDESILGTTKYAGNSGGDQPEVQNIMSVMDEHSDALLVLDFPQRVLVFRRKNQSIGYR